jgi:hypothetical protein
MATRVHQMNHSIYSANRTTHLKIVVIALALAIAVANLPAGDFCRRRQAPQKGPEVDERHSRMGECRPIGSGSHPGPQRQGLNRPARCCNSRSGLTIRSGDNPTSTVAATRVGRMGGRVRLSNHRISARGASLKSPQPAGPVGHVTG